MWGRSHSAVGDHHLHLGDDRCARKKARDPHPFARHLEPRRFEPVTVFRECPQRRKATPQIAVWPYLMSAPDRIRTCDLLLRRQALYPAELRARNGGGISRVLSPPKGRRIISLGPTLPPASCGLPGTVDRSPRSGQLLVPYSALLRVGFTMPRLLPARAVRSYRTVSPLPVDPKDPIGGLFSAALSVAFRRPGVTRHPALRSSDFPRHRHAMPRSSLASRLSNSAQERTRTSTPFPAPDP